MLIGSCAKKDDSTTTTTLSDPSGLTATGGAIQVTLDWTAVSGASSYTVYWDNATGVSSSSTAITSVSMDNYTHSSLDNGTTYYYKVAAVDSAGTGSRSSEVNATTTSTTSGCTVVTNCSSTAPSSSGSITGIDNGTLVRTYDKFIAAASAYTINSSTGCVSDSTLLSAYSSALPTGTASFKMHYVITSTTTWAAQNIYYSDSACSTEIASIVTGKSDLTVGDNVTGLTAGSSPTKPTSASKVTYKDSCMDLNPSTDAGTIFINNLISSSGITVVTGTRAI